MTPRNIVILGATGSIGESAAQVARTLPNHIKIVGLSGYQNQNRLLELVREFEPLALSTNDAFNASFLQSQLSNSINQPTIFYGEEGLKSLAVLPESETLLVAISGTAGLRPALAALETGKDLAIASKEILVMAGAHITETAKHYGQRILPVDSEHSAIFQCLEGHDISTVRRIILTCSGGPFRNTPQEKLTKITPEMALRHPTWSMGRKISIDSATLFNKALEMIEAQWLFGVPMEKIDVVIHPESIIHSMVEFMDGSILAQMSHTNMTLPIQYALTYPQRIAGPTPHLDLPSLGRLHFEQPREDIFPALNLARQAGIAGGTMPTVLNAANEVAVAHFLSGKISFPEIWKQVEHAMKTVPHLSTPSLEEIMTADLLARSL